MPVVSGQVPSQSLELLSQVHLESFPRCAASLLSSCRDLWRTPSPLAINLHTWKMQDFSLWQVLSKSDRYHIKGVNLVLHKSQKTGLPPELTSRCAFLHTLNLSNWKRLKNVSRCIWVRVIVRRTSVSLLRFYFEFSWAKVAAPHDLIS